MNNTQSLTIRAMRFAMIALAATAIGACAVTALVYLYPGLMVLSFRLQSDSPYCSLWNAVTDYGVSLSQREVAERNTNKTRLVATDGELRLFETPLGQYWLPSDNPWVLNILLAQQERDIYGDSDWGVREGDIVLDCGAHVGTYTRKALSRGAKLVVAIEPTPATVECLRRNLASEIREGKVIVYPKGIWDREGTLPLFLNDPSGVHNSFVSHRVNASGVARIPLTSIGILAEELKLPRVDFIKADIKGATEKALAGAKSVITRYKPRLALSTEELTEHPRAIAEILRQIRPDYEINCGPCLVLKGRIYTDVVLFR